MRTLRNGRVHGLQGAGSLGIVQVKGGWAALEKGRRASHFSQH
ncbi:MAG: hypothetical protein AAFY38_00850 [Pseudomonadota bacterium]